MTRLARWTLGSLSGVGILLVVVCALLYVLLATETGGRWLLGKVLPLAAEESHIGRVTGTLSRGITVESLQLPLEAAHIQVERAEGVWNLWNLLGGQFPIERLAVSGLTITLQAQDPEPEPQPPGPWPSLALPFTVNLLDGEVRDLRLIMDGQEHVIQHIALAGSGGLLHTRIQHLTVAMGEHRLALKGRIANRAPYDLDLDIDWSTRLPDELPLAGQGKLRGSLAALSLDHQLSAPVELFAALKAELPFDPNLAVIDPQAITVDLQSQWRDLELPHDMGLPPFNSDGELDVEGNWADYRFRLDTQIALEPATEENAADTPLPADLMGALSSGPLELALEGSGKELALQLQQLLLKSALGMVDARGDLNLAGPLAWNLDLALLNLDTAPLAPDWHARISTVLQTQGHWLDSDNYRFALDIAELQGNLRTHLVEGSGSVDLSPGQQLIEQLNLRLGDNLLAIDGQLGLTGGTGDAALKGELALKWQLKANALAQIHPDLKGSILSDGALSGTLDAPSGSARLEASAIGFGDIALTRAELHMTATDRDSLSLSLSATGLDAAPLEDATLTATLQGNLPRHRFAVELHDSTDNHLALTLEGALNKDEWRGQLRALELDNALIGSWRQAQDTALTLSGETVAVELLCLNQDAARFCARGRWHGQQLTASGTLDEFPLSQLTSPLPPELALVGEVNSRFQVSGPVDRLVGEVHLVTSDFALHHRPISDGEMVEYPAQISLDGTFAGGGANAMLSLELDDIGSLHAQLEAAALSADGQLRGSADGHFAHLTWLDALLPQVDNLEGQVNLALVLSGTAGQPEVNGNITLEGLGAEIPLAGIALREGEIRLGLDDSGQWQLHGEVSSGEGSLLLDGSGLISTEHGAAGEVHLAGNDFTLANRPDARVVVSPDLRLALTHERLQLRGDLAVTDGKITLNTLPEQAVGVSPDERLVQSETEESVAGRVLDARLQLSIDERFTLEGFGLSTRLGGDLRLVQRGEDPPRANGTLTLYDGVYQAYGQNLAVERGVLIFQGQVDNPGLNIRAVRKVQDYTVGIDIGGVAQDIRSELFSTPPLPPTDTIAILITGKVPGQMNKSDANQVINAVTALGISQSEGITNNLKNAFGLDVVDLQSGDDYLDSSLVVGKYLTPDLFVSYVQNLFTPAGSVVLDYALTRNLGLKASSGETQSIDFLYRIEHGGLD